MFRRKVGQIVGLPDILSNFLSNIFFFQNFALIFFQIVGVGVDMGVGVEVRQLG